MNTNRELFEEAPVPKAVALMAVPTMISMLVVVIYNMADTFFIGQTGDPLQVAAVSLATPIFMIYMALGNLFFLDVQVTSPWLFMVCFWGAGLVFTFIIYALVVSFANLGKAIAVLLLIVQVTGCGGSFPLQIMPAVHPGAESLAAGHPRGERHAKRHDGHLRQRLLGADGHARPVPHPGGAFGPRASQAPGEVHGMVRGKGGELEAHQLARAARPYPTPIPHASPLCGSECHFDPEMASQMPVEGRNGRKNSGMLPKNRPFRG